jgi:thiaminase (transcriptional activator TenA)
MQKFTQHLWKTISHIYQAICEQPFICELANGTLDRSYFVFYLQQDALYLADFAQALAHTAIRLKTPRHAEDFQIFSQGTLGSELELHTDYFQYFNVTPSTQRQPACFFYTHYLLSTANYCSVEEAVAALLPCFWIYAEVGKYIAKNSSTTNQYQKWIAMYSSDEFIQSAKKACGILDDLAAHGTPATLALMEQAFVYSSRLEHLFWDSAYKLDRWSKKTNHPLSVYS